MAASLGAWRKYLLQFAHEHLEFRVPELRSIAKLLNITVNLESEHKCHVPFLIVSLQSEDHAHKLIGRSMLIKSISELWAEGRDYDQLYSSLKQYPTERKEPFMKESFSYKINVDSFNKTLQLGAKISKIEMLLDNGFMPSGKINLSKPDIVYTLMESYQYRDKRDLSAGDTTEEQPEYLYFGRWVAGGQKEKLKKKYNLQERSYIGNTSMDPCLSLIMSNMGLVTPGSMIYDPFVGTGSLLVACAHFGGLGMGSDIDFKIVNGIGKSSRAGQKWRKRDENLRNCMKEYNLEHCYMDVLVADSSRPALFRQQPIFDAIITDPPYGIREQTKKVGPKGKESVIIPEEMKEGHIPSKQDYSLTSILTDLLNFAAKYLRVGGRLVYWLPVHKDDYSDGNIPSHKCMSMVANSEQPLNSRVSRRLITMEKSKHSQNEEEMNSASVAVDHYGEESFRDRYFRPTDKPTENVKRKKNKLHANSDREDSKVHFGSNQKDSNSDTEPERQEGAV